MKRALCVMSLLDAPLLDALTMSSSLAYIPFSQCLLHEYRDQCRTALVTVKEAEGYRETHSRLACLLAVCLLPSMPLGSSLVRPHAQKSRCKLSNDRWEPGVLVTRS